MKNRNPSLLLATVVSVFLAESAYALVNPGLQPQHLYDRYTAVVSVRVAAVDYEKHVATLVVTSVSKGAFAPKQVILSPAGDETSEVFEELMSEDMTIVAFIGKSRRQQERDILFYPGDGRWQVGLLESTEDPSKWQWIEDLGPEEMFGTFNGHADRLTEMMFDQSRGRYFFPAKPFTQFKDDLIIDKFEKPVRGVALYDIDGDSNLDIYACCENGDRAYLQAAPFAFKNATKELGLEDIRSASISFADVDADGRADLLAGGTIYLAAAGPFARGFTASKLLPPAGANVKSSAFVEINGDGYPDAVVSKVNGRLSVYLNPGPRGGPFVDATRMLGLDAKECGAGGNGFFAPGDWNQDGRTDLFYSVDKGRILLQQESGRFTAAAYYLNLNFKTGGEIQGLTGAGCFAPLWRSDKLDLITCSESSLYLVADIEGKPREMSCYGNELTECSFGFLGMVAEDFDADGYVDIYAASRLILPNVYYANRGYGSFMTPHKYKPQALPGQAHQRGAWGLAAGDVDGDGANDLLLGGVDGTLTLMVNDVLTGRKGIEHPTYDQKKLEQTSIVIVRVSGRTGVLGARLELTDAEGRIVGLRVIGSNVATGCRGPDMVNLAVREPGKYVLSARFSDGRIRKWPVDLSAGGKRTTLTVSSD